MSPESQDVPGFQSAQGATTHIETPKGLVTIRSHCPPDFFSTLKLDSGLGDFAHYSSLIKRLDILAQIVLSKDGKVVVAVVPSGGKDVVIAYTASYYPGPRERWAALGELMYEMAIIEVSRNYRGLHLSSIIFKTIMDDDFFEDKVAYMNGFSWHWDLDGSGLTMAEYRRMMHGLLRANGFQEYPTNEPNIAIREENLFMARVGSRVSEKDRRRFQNLLFGIVDDD